MKRLVRPTDLGAITDDPVHIANVAIREAKASRDQLSLRQAANKGWLAMASIADVIAARTSQVLPTSSVGRLNVLRRFEKETKIRRLTTQYELARKVLHGDCFHAAQCISQHATIEVIEDVKKVAEDALDALDVMRKQKRKR